MESIVRGSRKVWHAGEKINVGATLNIRRPANVETGRHDYEVYQLDEPDRAVGKIICSTM